MNVQSSSSVASRSMSAAERSSAAMLGVPTLATVAAHRLLRRGGLRFRPARVRPAMARGAAAGGAAPATAGPAAGPGEVVDDEGVAEVLAPVTAGVLRRGRGELRRVHLVAGHGLAGSGPIGRLPARRPLLLGVALVECPAGGAVAVAVFDDHVVVDVGR